MDAPLSHIKDWPRYWVDWGTYVLDGSEVSAARLPACDGPIVVANDDFRHLPYAAADALSRHSWIDMLIAEVRGG